MKGFIKSKAVYVFLVGVLLISLLPLSLLHIIITSTPTYATDYVVTYNSTPAGGNWTVPIGVTSVAVLVVAGGGGGGGIYEGGGGGGGGVVYNSSYPVVAGSNITITVGTGGAGGTSGGCGTNGSNSIFGSITTTGGGGGGASGGGDCKGKNGGSGGGGGGGSSGATTAGITIAPPTQGNNGGTGSVVDASRGGGGGGGGGTVGQGGSSSKGGDGGYGYPCSISGVSLNYSGGGGGGSRATAVGIGRDGGGNGALNGGAPVNATSGTDGLGGGGGGTERSGTQVGGKGGNGSVIMAYTITSYTLVYTAGAHGSINGSSPQTVNYGSNGSAVTAVANSCYHFVDWDDTSVENPRTDTNISANISVIANFAINISTVTYSAGAGGSVNGSWPENVNCGSNSSWVLATANSCYYFVNWSDASTTNPRREVNVTSNVSYTANFAIDVYMGEYFVSGVGGTVNGSWPENVNCGDNSSWVLATPDPCYHFVDWDDASTTNPRHEVNVTSDFSFDANFAINEYDLTTASSAGGDVTDPGESTYTYNCSDVVDIEATADPCYHFVNWTGDTGDIADVNDPTTTITMTANASITANFAIDIEVLTYNAGAGGSIVGDTPQNVNCGSDGTEVTATPDPCYHFVDWSDAVGTASRTDLGVTSNLTVTANFAIDIHTVTYTAGTHGSVNGSWPENINCGDNSSWVLATSDPCYHFVNWSDSSTTNPRHEVNVTANFSLTANFAINISTVTYSAGAGGSVNGSWPENVNCGSNSSWVLATANSCYYFVNWSDASMTNPRHEANVTSNLSFTANYAINTSVITYIAGAHGTIVGTAVQTVDCGAASTSVTATPNACYHFTSWSDANISATRTDIGTSSNKSFTASFAINIFTLNVSSGANGNVTTPIEGTHTYNCGQVVNLVATPNWAYLFSGWSGDTGTIGDINNETTTITMDGNYSINCSFIASTDLFPPTNIIQTLTQMNSTVWCLNLSWTKGVNSPYSVVVICRDTVLPCANKSTSVPSNCMVLYNGNGSSLDIETCGWQVDYYDYTITAWGSDGAGNYSALCTNLTLGGAKMLDAFYTGLAAFIALGLSAIGFWQKKTWVFLLAGMAWVGFGIWELTSGASGTLYWYFGWLGLVAGLVMFLAPAWNWKKDKSKTFLDADEEYSRQIDRETGKTKKED